VLQQLICLGLWNNNNIIFINKSVYISFIRVIRVPKLEEPNQKNKSQCKEVKSVEYGLENI
jgi:hypothetical protein